MAHLHLLPGGSILRYAEFPNLNGLTVTATAPAAAGATELECEVTSNLGRNYRIPAAAALYFQQQKFASLMREARAGDMTIEVAPIPAAIAQGDQAFYGPGAYQVATGSLVGRTFAERDQGEPFGAADIDGDDEIYLLAFCSSGDLTDDNRCTLLRHNTMIYEDRLPGWASMPAAKQGKIRQLYQCLTSEDI